MDVVVILVFISLILVCAALAFFVSRLRGGDFDHGARLSLLPLADDEGGPTEPVASPEDLEGSPEDLKKGSVHGNS